MKRNVALVRWAIAVGCTGTGGCTQDVRIGSATNALSQDAVALETSVADGAADYLDRFGTSSNVVKGDTAVVGAPNTRALINSRLLPHGAVHLYARDASGWSPATVLAPPELTVRYFGMRVALDGDTLAVSALGRVFVYERVSNEWRLQTELLPSDRDLLGADLLVQYGYALALRGNTIVVGASSNGACSQPLTTPCYTDRAYVYERAGTGWSQTALLRAGDSTGSGRERFGFSVVVDGSRIVVGAAMTNAAYIYEKSSSEWGQRAKLTPTGITKRAYGSAVALEGGTLIVVDFLDVTGNAGYRGAAHVYAQQPDGEWLLQAKISPPTPTPTGDMYFGTSVALAGDVAFFGAPTLQVGLGRVYGYERTGTTWAAFAQLAVPPGRVEFGNSVDFDGVNLIVGHRTSDLAAPLGTVDLYRIAPPTPPDTDGDGVYDPADNCALVSNADQLDQDEDRLGDACDADLDGDGLDNTNDNCPGVANAAQEDLDGDAAGDVCDDDDDGDAVTDAEDNCHGLSNPDQADSDLDERGDACDPDDDNDGASDPLDNCPLTANADQLDADVDGRGDVCDDDVDADGVVNEQDVCAATPLFAAVDSQGCSGPQLVEYACPASAFSVHGQYVQCVARTATAARQAGLLAEKERARIVALAARSR